MATEPHFKKNIIRSGRLSIDRPIKAIDETIFYVDRVLKSRNGEFDFRNRLGKIGYCEYFYGELLVILSFLLLLLV